MRFQLHVWCSALLSYLAVQPDGSAEARISAGGGGGKPSHHHLALLARHEYSLFTPGKQEAWDPSLGMAESQSEGQNDTQVEATAGTSVLDDGRFGHAAAYLPSRNSVLFIGGQVSQPGTFITNDVVRLDLDSGKLSPAPKYATDLSPNAWTASAVTQDEHVWLVGGISQDCSQDQEEERPVAVHLESTLQPAWASASSPSSSSSASLRRKLAKAVPVQSPETNINHLWVWGGISDPYTCSPSMQPYLAVDAWDTEGHNVTTITWDYMLSRSPWWPSYYLMPPITDYTAIHLPDSPHIAFFGGRTVDKEGNMTILNYFAAVAILDTDNLSWTRKKTAVKSEPYPTPREGHVMVQLSNTTWLLHGGVTEDGTAAEDSWVLDLETWQYTPWRAPEKSLDPPKLAWHTATKVSDDEIIFAFGLNPESGSTSDRIYSFSRDADSQEWAWAEHKHHHASSQTQPDSASETDNEGSLAQEPSADVSNSRANTDNSSAKDEQAANTTKLIAGSVGGVAAFAATATAAVLFVRRRRKAKEDTFRVLNVYHQGGPTSHPQADQQPVSELQYTRPVPQRMLSLGSTVTHQATPDQTPIFRTHSNLSDGSDPSVTSYPYLQPMHPSTGDGSSLISDNSQLSNEANVGWNSNPNGSRSFLSPADAASSAAPSPVVLAKSSDSDEVRETLRQSVAADTRSPYTSAASILEAYAQPSPRPEAESEGTPSATSTATEVGSVSQNATPRMGHSRHFSDEGFTSELGYVAQSQFHTVS